MSRWVSDVDPFLRSGVKNCYDVSELTGFRGRDLFQVFLQEDLYNGYSSTLPLQVSSGTDFYPELPKFYYIRH